MKAPPQSMAYYELEALMTERMILGQPYYQPMEATYQRLPGLFAVAEEAKALVEMVQEHPELIHHIRIGEEQ